mgnify:CR=1 FL=1
MKKWGWSWQIKTSSISLAMLCLLSATEISVFSDLNAIASQKKKQDTVVIFQPPPEDAQPEETGGAASRNGNKCPGDMSAKADRSKFKAIVPQSNSGLTTKEYPTFWASIPPTTAQSAILSIAKVGEKPYWHQAIALTNRSGLIGIKLDSNAPGLEIDQNYRWALVLVCNPHPHPSDPVVTAGIKRIDRNLPSNITSLELANWYAERGIWYDALNILAGKKSLLNNGEFIWSKYLRSGGILIDN